MSTETWIRDVCRDAVSRADRGDITWKEALQIINRCREQIYSYPKEIVTTKNVQGTKICNNCGCEIWDESHWEHVEEKPWCSYCYENHREHYLLNKELNKAITEIDTWLKENKGEVNNRVYLAVEEERDRLLVELSEDNFKQAISNYYGIPYKDIEVAFRKKK